MAYQRRPGAAYEIFRKRVAALGEGQRDLDPFFADVDRVDHSQLDYGLVLPPGVSHLLESEQYVFSRRHYLTMFISSSRRPAPPNLSRISNT